MAVSEYMFSLIRGHQPESDQDKFTYSTLMLTDRALALFDLARQVYPGDRQLGAKPTEQELRALSDGADWVLGLLDELSRKQGLDPRYERFLTGKCRSGEDAVPDPSHPRPIESENDHVQ